MHSGFPLRKQYGARYIAGDDFGDEPDQFENMSHEIAELHRDVAAVLTHSHQVEKRLVPGWVQLLGFVVLLLAVAAAGGAQ